jgi:hypothetical protein
MPITVRPAEDGSADFLLVKGQGRTLACRLLGIETIPGIVVGDDFDQRDKVQQFLVENVARAKMSTVDRALLVARARREGEETIQVARRFGISARVVRKLEAQLEGASSIEIAALRSGALTLAVQAVIARYVPPAERSETVNVLTAWPLTAAGLDLTFRAFGWDKLVELGPAYSGQRVALFSWICGELRRTASGNMQDRLRQTALRFPPNRDQVSLFETLVG